MTTTNVIKCPNCGHEFSLSDIQKHEMEALREKMEAEVKEDMKKKAFSWAQEELKKERKAAEEARQKDQIELEALRKRDSEARAKEMEFIRQQNEFRTLQQNLELEKEKVKLEERKRLEDEFTQQMQTKIAIEMEREKMEAEKKLRAKDEQIAQMQRSIEDAKRK